MDIFRATGSNITYYGSSGAGQNALPESYGERICSGDLEPGFFEDFFII